ncbi:MAG TPA: ABC transporter permease [Acidobacteriota bacterium]|nr:ABC transporter permease [Acidobacteriota bacterium]
MRGSLRELYEFRELLGNLVVNELKLRYRNSALGFLWTILNPLAYLAVLSVVFSRVFRFEIPNYTVFLFSGLVAWASIQQTVIIATPSIVANQGFIRRVYVPKLVFPLSNVLARYVDHVILTVILFGAMAVFRAPFSWSLLFLPIALLLNFAFSLGCVLVATTAHIRIRDIEHIVPIGFQILFFATPILYTVDVLPHGLRPLLLLNPVYYFVQAFRYPVAYASIAPGWVLGRAALLAAAALVIGLYVFFRKEKEFVYHLS